MSDKERDSGGRTSENQTEEPIQDPSSDDFEAHRDVGRDSSGLPNRDAEADRQRDGQGERQRDFDV